MNSSTSMKKEAVAKLELALDLNLSTTLLQQASMVEPFYIFSGESSASMWSDNRMQDNEVSATLTHDIPCLHIIPLLFNKIIFAYFLNYSVSNKLRGIDSRISCLKLV